jgi:hypothetical protein
VETDLLLVGANGIEAAMEQADLVEQVESEAEYTLESPVKCVSCHQTLQTVQVVRLLRTKVNFTSSLPRRGYVVVCPSCQAIVPAGLG